MSERGAERGTWGLSKNDGGTLVWNVVKDGEIILSDIIFPKNPRNMQLYSYKIFVPKSSKT